MGKRRAIATVINDLYSDQRVDKTCRELIRAGYELTLVGRMLPWSPPMDERPYFTRRLSMIFRSGVLMYLEFQIRLFLWLLTHKGQFFWSNDLDTILPCFLVAKIRNVPLIQDSHEYFTGVPELADVPLKRRTWKLLERFTFPKADELITVNESLAELFREEYNREVHVIRNVPPLPTEKELKNTMQPELSEENHILLMEGAGINIQRGAEELLQAMRYVDEAVLYFIGSGDVIGKLKEMARSPDLQDRVVILGRQSRAQLFQYTRHSTLGFSLDKPTSINYQNSLPNKLFDYIQANLPVIVSEIPEVASIVREYDIGLVIPDHQPETIAEMIKNALTDKERYQKWKENLKFAARELNWENEQQILQRILTRYV